MTARSELPIEQQPAAPLAPGDVVAGKYRIDELAGTGGMALVFAAHHLVLDHRVAVKVLVGDGVKDPLSTERFVREAQAAARLQSEHAVRVMDAGVLTTGHPYLVMEYLEGCDLGELLVLSGPMEPSELVDYMLQALEGIAHAHAADIVHRDVKPSNLFITLRPDGSNLVKVLDFGISKSTVEHANPEVTKLTGKAVLGSPAYMSPEQVRNASGVDARSDVWSLGVSIYELLTGRMPFEGDGVGATLAAILEADAVPVHALRPEIPRGLSDAVARCLRRRREERWSDVGELAQAIAPFGSGTCGVYPDRIAATLVNSRQLRPPTPFGAFEVTSLDTLVTNPQVDPLGATQPPPPSTGNGFVVDQLRLAQAQKLTEGDPSLVTQPGRRATRRARWVFLAAALGVAGIVALVATRARLDGSTAAPPPWVASSAPPVPPPAPSPSPVVAAPPAAAIVATGATAAPVVTVASASAPAPAASSHRPPHKWRSSPASTDDRPAILHSRN